MNNSELQALETESESLNKEMSALLARGGVTSDELFDLEMRIENLNRRYRGAMQPTADEMKAAETIIDESLPLPTAPRAKFVCRYVQLLRKATAEKQAAAQAAVAVKTEPTIKPLTDREQYTVRAILSVSPVAGMTGEKIIDFVFEHFDFNMDLSTLTSSIFPALRTKGIPIANAPRAGYFISDPTIREYLAKVLPPVQKIKSQR